MLDTLFNKTGSDLSAWEAALRGLLVYLAAIAIVRFGKKRFIGQTSAFDMIVAVILGSILSRAVNGGSRFWPSISAGAAVVFAHWLLSWLAHRYRLIDGLTKGHSNPLVKDGVIQEQAMAKHHLTKEDLLGAMRLWGNTDRLNSVHLATLERSGRISIVPSEGPTVLETRVEEGVQVIRIEIRGGQCAG